MIKGTPGKCYGIPLAAALGVLLFLAACQMNPGGGEGAAESRTFYVQRVDTNEYESVNALKLAEGSRCIVFAAAGGQVSSQTAGIIAAEYDTRIYPIISGVFGDYYAAGLDVDGNGKIILLLVDIQDGYEGEGGYVAGYFSSYHLYQGASSNQADMLFIDINPQDPGSTGFYANIAHELQHLINFAIHDRKSQELWLNEGLSSAAEYLYAGHRTDRIAYFNEDPVNRMDTIAYGNNFFVWDGYWEKEYGDSLANYATAYLFFQWLRIQAGGTGIYSDISRSGGRDYRALTNAARTRIPGLTETDDEKLWDQLLSSWMIANLANAPAGLYGYNGEIETQVRGFTDAAIQTAQFFPGEGVYSSLEGGKSLSSSDAAGSGPHIKYLGIGGTRQEPEIDNAAPYTGSVLLTYNANPASSGAHETGKIMDYSPAFSSVSPAFGGAARSALPSGGLPRSYPIGAHDLRSHGKGAAR